MSNIIILEFDFQLQMTRQKEIDWKLSESL